MNLIYNDKYRNELVEIVELGDKALKEDFIPDKLGDSDYDAINGGSHDRWLAKVKIYMNKYLRDCSLYTELDNKLIVEDGKPDRARQINEWLKAILEDDDYWNIKLEKLSIKETHGIDDKNNTRVINGQLDMSDQRKKLSGIIALGDKALNVDYHIGNGLSYMSGRTYDSWLGNIKTFAKGHLTDHPLYSDLLAKVDKENGYPNRARRIQEYLKVIENDDEYWNKKQQLSINNANNSDDDNSETNKLDLPSKIFISHNSKDAAFAIAFVKLFRAIGVGKNQIVCTSVPECGVPLVSGNIYDWLKQQFNEYNLHVLFLLSDNYYNSSASLNEMGAAWVLQQKCDTVMLPGFKFEKIKGAIDPSKIAIALGDDEKALKYRLKELRDEVINEFNLQALDEEDWEESRDEFIENILKSQLEQL